MTEISLLLWDIGGVVLSNGWDETDRHAAADRFGLDAEEFERRHQNVMVDFETGRLGAEEYLSRTVFYTPRPFSREAFQKFMLDCSVPLPSTPGTLAMARGLRAGGKYLMAALNNESLLLNQFRIASFHLAEVFQVFFSSCFTGRRKPDPDAYRYPLQITQRAPEEALFLDDRLDNVKAAAQLGLRTLWVRDPATLREELAGAGVTGG